MAAGGTPAPRIRRPLHRVLLFLLAVFVAVLGFNVLFGVAVALSGAAGDVAAATDAAAALEAVPPALLAAGNGFSFGGLLLVTLLFWLLIDRRPLAALGIGCDRRHGRLFLLGLAAGGLLVAVLFAATAALDLAALRGLRDAAAGRMAVELAVQFAVLAVAAAAEEAVFRGYLLRNLSESAGRLVAVLLTSALFSLFHLSNPNILGSFALPNIFLIGAVLAVACLRWESLWLPFGLHFGWNFMLGPVLAVPVSGAALFPGLFETDWPAGETLWSGGAFGLEGGLLCTLVTGLLLAAISLRRRGGPTSQSDKIRSREEGTTRR